MMKTRSTYFLAAAATATALLASALTIDGCGSIACTETDTCPESADGGGIDATKRETGAEKDAARDATKPVDGRESKDVATETGEEVEPLDGETEEEPSTDAPTDAPVDAPTDTPADTPADTPTDTPADTPADVPPDVPPPPTCASPNVCAPKIPSGWTGPIALYDPGANAAAPPPSPVACVSDSEYTTALPSAGSTQLGNYSLVGATNLGCSCGSCGAAPTAITCTNPTVSLSYEPCGDTAGNLFYGPATAPTACTSTGSGGGHPTTSVTVALSTTAPTGTCAAPSTKETGAWTAATGWLGTGSACSTGKAGSSYPSGTAGGCTGTDICVPPPPSTFNGGTVCIFFNGKAACPAGSGYTTEHDYFTDNDSQTCDFSSCACNATGLTCSPEVTVSGTSSCSGTSTMSNLAVGCTGIANYGPPTYLSTTTTSSGSCTLSGTAVANGSVVTTGQVTVCCN
jgi:hypothetical protein